MPLNVDWEGLHQDWRSSGMSMNRYAHDSRVHRFIRNSPVPAPTTIRQRLGKLEKQKSCAVVPVYRLNAQDVSSSLAGTHKKDRIHRQPQAQRVSVVLPNGSQIQFDSTNPELFALMALKLGGVS